MTTIRIVRGPGTAVREHCARFYAYGEAYWLEIELLHEWRRPVAGIRCLLPQMRSRLGDETFDRILSRCRPAASLVLSRLGETLTPAESLRRGALAGCPTSNLSHNWFIQRPLIEEWATLLHSLLLSSHTPVVVPSLRELDPITFTVFRSLYRMFPDAGPELIVGIDTDDVEAPKLDARGIAWESLGDKDREAICLSLPGRKVMQDLSEAAAPRSAPESTPGRSAIDPLDDDLDWRAVRALIGSSGSPEPEIVEGIVEAMQRAFRCYDFTPSLRLGVELLARQPELEPQQAAKVHSIIALSAHNRQFRAAGNLELADFIALHLEEALRVETDPASRVCLLYRLAVALGRRKGDLETAMEWADQALGEAREAQLPVEQGAVLKAWSLNIRSYLHMRQKNLAEAFADSRAGFELLADAASRLGELSRETIFLYTLLPDNLATLYHFTGQNDQMKLWLEKCQQLSRRYIGSGDRFSSLAWIRVHRRDLRMDLAAEEAAAGLADARDEIDPLRQAIYLRSLGDLHYRLGDAATSYRYLRELLDSHQRPGEEKEWLSIEVSAAASAFRAGYLDQARERLERARSHPLGRSPLPQAEIVGWMALVAAKARDRADAEDLINQAIGLAVESGERDILLWVARTAGDVCQLLDRAPQALEAYARALALAEAGDGEPAPPAVDTVGVLLGLVECGQGGVAEMQRALLGMPEALKDAEAWWDVPRLLARLTEIADRDATDLENEAATEALAKVLVAAAQREDCAPGLEKLCRKLPSSLQRDAVC